jgi:hypothetical protein
MTTAGALSAVGAGRGEQFSGTRSNRFRKRPAVRRAAWTTARTCLRPNGAPVSAVWRIEQQLDRMSDVGLGTDTGLRS